MDRYPKPFRLQPQIKWLESQFRKEWLESLAKIKNENDEAARKESLLWAGYEVQTEVCATKARMVSAAVF
jgi:hypothetical protein